MTFGVLRTVVLAGVSLVGFSATADDAIGDAGPQYNRYDTTLDWAKAHGCALDDVVFIGDDFADGGGDSHVRIKGMDHVVISDCRNFARAVRVLLK